MKRLASILLLFILLYQAGGFALRYVADSSTEFANSDSESDSYVVKIPISLPYPSNREIPQEASGALQQGDDFYQMVDQKIENDTLYTRVVNDKNARDQFLDLADLVNEHLSDQPDKAPVKSKLIQTLVKEYCQSNSAWIFYILEWPNESTPFQHSKLKTSSFQDALFSPPRQA
ncbi:hypothetical protein EWU23_04420 [Cytophagaceae bacterium 50C-KIRBA]|uniref:Secreted protein n=1 Tax=Aquirufa beregesia TaxID=2516556 RepID=A0ABX0EV73_9BACT|nr:hypothetical protein [Aquirufa beregesia]NGZ43715.1 hypothetical protein [Aquirufa beregesia]